jgi:hypothetical protein
MTPQKRININKKSRNRGRGGTRRATASSVGPTTGQRTARRGGGGRQEKSGSAEGVHSVPASASGACSVEAALSRSCEKESDGKILLTTALAFSLWRMTPRFWKSCSCTTSWDSPVRTDLVLASSIKILVADGPHEPPQASATMGANAKPSSMQRRSVERWLRLKSSYFLTAERRHLWQQGCPGGPR